VSIDTLMSDRSKTSFASFPEAIRKGMVARAAARRHQFAGLQDGIDQPAIEGSGVNPLPGQGQSIKAGEFILGGEAGFAIPIP
jgi:hypothetical protein